MRSINQKNTPSEHQEQCEIFKWAKLMEGKYPELKYMFGTLNGVKLTIGQATKAKRGGNKKGVCDIVWPYSNGKYSGLFIELKVGKNTASKEQRDFIKFTRDQGYYSDVRYGSKEAIDLIIDYIEGHI